VVSEEMIEGMKAGSVVVDVSIDQGGCFETSRVTNHIDPTFIKHGVVHYCVPNITSRVPRTASVAISNILTPILLHAASQGASNLGCLIILAYVTGFIPITVIYATLILEKDLI
jgi:alanine dehydrogenase